MVDSQLYSDHGFKMHRLLIFLLLIFCVALVAEIVGVAIWRDYQRHGDFAPGRALGSAVHDARQAVGWRTPSDEAVDNPPRQDNSTAFAAHLPAMKAELLYLVNTERVRAQVPPLTPGSNPAAQHHAESMNTYGYRSHWDIFGLTPQMRYTLAGGANRVMELVTGPVAITEEVGPESESWSGVVRQAHRQFMEDSESRVSILDHLHRSLNVGLACTYTECWVVQQLEGGQFSFSEPPAVSESVFHVAGEFREGYELDAVVLWHHPYPRRLSLGQLDATYRYGYGQKPVTFLRPPLAADRYYPDHLANYEWNGGLDPYTLDVSLPRNEAGPLLVEVAHSAAVPWTTASRWEQSGPAFSVQADLADVLDTHGPGVYTVQIWGRRGQQRVPLTNYTIFVP